MQLTFTELRQRELKRKMHYELLNKTQNLQFFEFERGWPHRVKKCWTRAAYGFPRCRAADWGKTSEQGYVGMINCHFVNMPGVETMFYRNCSPDFFCMYAPESFVLPKRFPVLRRPLRDAWKQDTTGMILREDFLLSENYWDDKDLAAIYNKPQ